MAGPTVYSSPQPAISCHGIGGALVALIQAIDSLDYLPSPAAARALHPLVLAAVKQERQTDHCVYTRLVATLNECGWSMELGIFHPQCDLRLLAARLKPLQYTAHQLVGQGCYSAVYRAVKRLTGEAVTLKHLKLETTGKDGLASYALREVSVLQDLVGCPHIVQLREVLWDRSRLIIAMELLDRDLREHLDREPSAMHVHNVKRYMWQLFSGMAHAHARRVLHRDLKPHNILVDLKSNSVKLADFGLARTFLPPVRPYTHEVVTLLYRPPELLLGATRYCTAVDVWSLGCIMAELLTGEPLFQGDSEIGQLYRIFEVLGTPDKQTWPAVSSLPDWQPGVFPTWPARSLAETLPMLDPEGLDLLHSMLAYDPAQRISCRKALQHPWFSDVAAAEQAAEASQKAAILAAAPPNAAAAQRKVLAAAAGKLREVPTPDAVPTLA